jgi:hypothetical protein
MAQKRTPQNPYGKPQRMRTSAAPQYVNPVRFPQHVPSTKRKAAK